MLRTGSTTRASGLPQPPQQRRRVLVARLKPAGAGCHIAVSRLSARGPGCARQSSAGWDPVLAGGGVKFGDGHHQGIACLIQPPSGRRYCATPNLARFRPPWSRPVSRRSPIATWPLTSLAAPRGCVNPASTATRGSPSRFRAAPTGPWRSSRPHAPPSPCRSIPN